MAHPTTVLPARARRWPGSHRLSRRVALVTENYAVPGIEGALPSGGARLFGE